MLKCICHRVLPTIAAVLLGFANCPAYSQEDVGIDETSQLTSVEATDPSSTDFLFSGEEPTTVAQLREMEKQFAELAKKVFPATVNIRMGGAQGTGVVVSDDGTILTAAHVIAGPADEAIVTFMNEDGTIGREVKAERKGVERGIDSGMLKIKESEGESFPYLDVGLSSELNLGQWVLAVGHPGGLDPARGMVVRVGRITFRNARYLKTDCTLVGGDSGGPLVDMNGDVIGIHSRIGQRLLDNVHVPIDTYSEKWDELAMGIVLDGDPSLGFNVKEDSNEVESVNEKGPAEMAGLQDGDKIIKIGSEIITNKLAIRNAIRKLNLRPKKLIDVVVVRKGEEMTIELQVGEKRRR